MGAGWVGGGAAGIYTAAGWLGGGGGGAAGVYSVCMGAESGGSTWVKRDSEGDSGVVTVLREGG